MKVREKCVSCGRIFWAKAVRNRITRKVESLDNICQVCKNQMRQKQNLEHLTEIGKPYKVRIVPEEFENKIRERELHRAEMERRREEDKAKKEDKQTDLVKDYNFPKTKNKLRLIKNEEK